ncbi:MAG: dihydropteroate synthase [Deltaproteobacteria bacterium]|nr:dihydropteroate synthase [Deltaproteobacteria bacterium]MBW1816179.1 dihydropteroate synthase [Deltaproteobacteria bacterium]
MIVIGERINTSRKAINEAMDRRDKKFFQDEAAKQEAAGASYIDVNCGSRLKSEYDDFLWLLEVVQEVISIPISLDSPSAGVLAAGLKNVDKRPLVNSITLEKERFEEVAPIIEGDKADIVALCMDNDGIPNNTPRIVENATALVEKLEKLGLKREGIFLDPLIQPLSVGTENANMALGSISAIMTQLSGVHITCGLSNVSYGLPERFLVNRTFMVLAMAHGLDSAIIDPLDKKMMTNVITAETLLGKDEYCGDFIEAMREGRLEP